MNKNLVTAVTGLKLVGLKDLQLYKRIRNRVVLAFIPGNLSFLSIPGTVLVASNQTEKGYEKSITFKVPSENYALADTLSAYEEMRIVAIYADARGEQRVCGSPEYPLRLRYTIQDGVAVATLTGTDIRDDAYLMLA